MTEYSAVVQDRANSKGDWLYRPTFPDEWERRPLYSLAQWVNGLAFRNIEFTLTGKPVIKIAEIKGGISGQTKFTQQTFDESVHVRPGDLLFAWSGQPETSIDAFWWQGPEGWLNQHIFRVTAHPDVDTTFFYYLLRYLKPNFVGIARNKQTTGLGHVTKADLQRIEAALPPLDEQRAIARVLGALDDKIELNRRMSATLEAMARALFKSWFVDFAPVRAKAAGRPSGLPPALDALFPASFEASELGEIPAGWGVGRLGEFFELAVGGVWGKDGPDERASEPLQCLRGIDCHALAEGQMPDAQTRWFNLRQLTKRGIPSGTILLEGSGSFCGRSLLWRDDLNNLFDQAPIYSNFVKRLDRTNCSVSQAAVCWQFIREAFREGEIQVYRTGTAFPNLDVKGLLANLVVVVPPEPVADRYAELGGWGPSAERMAQSQALAAQRDALLPRLVSGEVRVGDRSEHGS